MGAHHSKHPHDIVMKEKDAFDVKHRTMLDNIEFILGNELNENMQSRKTLETSMDHFIRESLQQNGHFDQHVLQLVNIAKEDKTKDDADWAAVLNGWTDIIRNNEVDLSDNHKQDVLERCHSVLTKEKQVENFLYDKEVLTQLEHIMYCKKLTRDKEFRNLLWQIDVMVKDFKHNLYHEHANNIYKIEDEVSVKDREYTYSHNMEVKDHLDEIIKRSVTTETDVDNLKRGLCAAITQDRSDANQNCTQYANSISDIIRNDQKSLDKKYEQLFVDLKKMVDKYNESISNDIKDLPDTSFKIMQHGWYDIIYQKYRNMKYEIFRFVRSENILPSAKRNEIIDEMNRFRKTNKADTEDSKNARHENLRPTLQKILVEDETKHIDSECKNLYEHLEELINTDKEFMDTKRKSVYDRLADLVSKDQKDSDLMMKDLITKVDRLYTNGNYLNSESTSSSQSKGD